MLDLNATPLIACIGLSEFGGTYKQCFHSGKSAADCTAEVAASKSALSVTWLFRQPHWPVPRQLLGMQVGMQDLDSVCMIASPDSI